MRPLRRFIIGSLAIAAAVPVAVAATTANGARADQVPVTAFVRVDAAGVPARWDPCARLQWKIAGTRPSARLMKAATETMRQVRVTTGLRFVFAGRATHAEFVSPPMNTIVIGATSNLGIPNAGGITNVLYQATPSGSVAVTGARVAVNPIVVRPGTRWSWMLRPIVLHEVGHAIGLAHVSQSSEIMYPQVVRAMSYTADARVYLRELGTAKGCLGTPSA